MGRHERLYAPGLRCGGCQFRLGLVFNLPRFHAHQQHLPRLDTHLRRLSRLDAGIRMNMQTERILDLQTRLNELGYGPLISDAWVAAGNPKAATL